MVDASITSSSTWDPRTYAEPCTPFLPPVNYPPVTSTTYPTFRRRKKAALFRGPLRKVWKTSRNQVKGEKSNKLIPRCFNFSKYFHVFFFPTELYYLRCFVIILRLLTQCETNMQLKFLMMCPFDSVVYLQGSSFSCAWKWI